MVQTVYDRLLIDDHESERNGETDLGQLIEAIARDLRDLLNTPQWMRYKKAAVEGQQEDLAELSESLAAYGLPDFSTVSPGSDADWRRLRNAIEDAVNRFEPRLEFVEVIDDRERTKDGSGKDTNKAGGHILQFRIEARLKLDDEDLPVVFEAVLQRDNGRYSVKVM